MKTLYIHADFMEYETKKATPVAESLPEGHASGRMEEVLVAFITVEKSDEGKVSAVAAEAAADLIEVQRKVGAERVLALSLCPPEPRAFRPSNR